MFCKTLEELKSRLAEVRNGRRLVFTNGCFDILHVGHVTYLKEAKACGDLLLVGINSDASVKRLKGPERPLQKQDDRAEILSSLRVVDFTVLFDEDTPLNLIEAISPDVLVKGGDWAMDQIVGSEHVLKNGGEVKSLNFIQGRSTSNVVDKIKNLNS